MKLRRNFVLNNVPFRGRFLNLFYINAHIHMEIISIAYLYSKYYYIDNFEMTNLLKS